MPKWTLDEVLAYLKNVNKGTKGFYSACCPAHNDTSPSLSVWVDRQDRVRVKCFAGCSEKDIFENLELRREQCPDLMPKKTKKTKKKNKARTKPGAVEAIYQYRNADGTLNFEVVRRAGKDIKQRRPLGNGKYANNMKGVRRTL